MQLPGKLLRNKTNLAREFVGTTGNAEKPKRKFPQSVMDSSKTSGGLSGKVCIVTGANTGIGKETTLAIAALGMRIRHHEEEEEEEEEEETFVTQDGRSRLVVGTGAHVVLACRNLEKADAAIAEIREELRARANNKKQLAAFGVEPIANVEDASMESMNLDLSDLASVRTFSQAFTAKHKRLDLLILNAGALSGRVGLPC